MKWQFTLRQLLVALFLVAGTLAWYSWRGVWDTKKTIIVTDAREKVRADGTVAWELYSKEKTVYADSSGRAVAPPAISKVTVVSGLLVVFLVSGVVRLTCPSASTGFAKELVIAGFALPTIVFMMEVMFFIGDVLVQASV